MNPETISALMRRIQDILVEIKKTEELLVENEEALQQAKGRYNSIKQQTQRLQNEKMKIQEDLNKGEEGDVRKIQ